MEKTKGEISESWDDVRKSWNEHIEGHAQAHGRPPRHTRSQARANNAAERADDDAAFAIDYVYTALVEAEYAVLDAYLAHKEADELVQATPNS